MGHDVPVASAEMSEGDAAWHPQPPAVRLPWAQGGQLAADGAAAAPPGWRKSLRPPRPDGARAPVAVDAEAIVGLAVALDLLATQTRPLAAGPEILAQLTDALLGLRLAHADPQGLFGADADGLGALMRDLALGPVGEARAALAAPLAACSQALGAIPSTPEGVAMACRRLEAAAAAAIEHALLLMAARDGLARAPKP